MHSRLDKYANVAVLVSSILLIVWVIDSLTGHGIVKGVQGWRESRIRGQQILSALKVESGDSRLVVAVSTNCGACMRELATYRRLLSEEVVRGKVRIQFVGPQPAEILRPFLSGISPEVNVESVDLKQLGVRATPTLMLVDAKGRLAEEWEGVLGDRYKEVLKAVRTM